MKGNYRKFNPSPHKKHRVPKKLQEELKLPSIGNISLSKASISSIRCDRAKSVTEEPHEKDENVEMEMYRYHRSALANSTKHDLRLMRARILSRLSLCNRKEVRRSEIAYHESILLDLQEQGFKESAEYLKALLDFEKDYRSTPDNVADSNNWPWLYSQKTLLKIIISRLKEAEVAKKKDKKIIEMGAWLQIAVFIAKRKSCWYWVADLIFRKCIQKVVRLKSDRKRREAYVRFTYGQFLLEKLNLIVDAIEQLNMARKICYKRNLKGIDMLELNEYNSHLYAQTCFYLYKGLTSLAKESRDTNPNSAVNLSKKALTFIESAYMKSPEHENAILELALSLIAAKDYDSAINKLNVFQAICRRNEDEEGICRALYHRAHCYERMEKRYMAYSDLKNVCSLAAKCKLADISILCELEFSELLISLAPQNPLDTLKVAAYAYNLAIKDQNKFYQLRARCLIGFAEGQYLWNDYSRMVAASSKNHKAFKSLLEWKFFRQPFKDKQIQTFAMHVPKRGIQVNMPLLEQITQFVLPDKLFEIFGEKINFSSKFDITLPEEESSGD